MSYEHEVDAVITVSGHVEKGYFYLDNREFQGPFEKGEQASQAALENCNLSSPGDCRAIYHGSVRVNSETLLREPMADMRQTDTVEYQ